MKYLLIFFHFNKSFNLFFNSKSFKSSSCLGREKKFSFLVKNQRRKKCQLVSPGNFPPPSTFIKGRDRKKAKRAKAEKKEELQFICRHLFDYMPTRAQGT